MENRTEKETAPVVCPPFDRTPQRNVSGNFRRISRRPVSCGELVETPTSPLAQTERSDPKKITEILTNRFETGRVEPSDLDDCRAALQRDEVPLQPARALPKTTDGEAFRDSGPSRQSTGPGDTTTHARILKPTEHEGSVGSGTFAQQHTRQRTLPHCLGHAKFYRAQSIVLRREPVRSR